MNVVRHAEIERPPSELLDAVARAYDGFIISPTVLSDEGRIFRVVTTGGGTAPHTETIRAAPAGAGRSVVDVTVEDGFNSMLDRLFSRGSMRRSLEATADTLIARLQRGDLRPDAVENARVEEQLRETKQKLAELESASPSLAKSMAEARSNADRALAQDPPTISIEILTLDGTTRYRNAVVVRIPAR